MVTPVAPAITIVAALFRDLGCTEPLTQAFIKVALQDICLFDAKQHDRGPENIARFGERGVLIRVTDKLSRIHRICWDGVRPQVSEPVENEWADLSVYGVIARLCSSGNWPGAAPAKDVLVATNLPRQKSLASSDWFPLRRSKGRSNEQ